ncbi:MAG: hypothetical protein E7408_01830 [Ruminococcaceae bacterium]|nr:hypothetical protein [Oscillospiraceae bacterium]
MRDVVSDAEYLAAEERTVFYDMLMTEGGTYDGNVWRTSRVENGTTYYLFVNSGQTAFSANVEGAYAREIVTENGSSVSDRASGGFTATLPPRSSLFFSTGDTALPGLYVGNTLKNSFAEGIVLRTAGAYEMGALYQRYGNAWELVRVYADGDSVTAGEGTYKFKTFLWDAALSPQHPAISVGSKTRVTK